MLEGPSFPLAFMIPDGKLCKLWFLPLVVDSSGSVLLLAVPSLSDLVAFGTGPQQRPINKFKEEKYTEYFRPCQETIIRYHNI
jgi:hypothetical protein